MGVDQQKRLLNDGNEVVGLFSGTKAEILERRKARGAGHALAHPRPFWRQPGPSLVIEPQELSTEMDVYCQSQEGNSMDGFAPESAALAGCRQLAAFPRSRINGSSVGAEGRLREAPWGQRTEAAALGMGE